MVPAKPKLISEILKRRTLGSANGNNPSSSGSNTSRSVSRDRGHRSASQKRKNTESDPAEHSKSYAQATAAPSQASGMFQYEETEALFREASLIETEELLSKVSGIHEGLSKNIEEAAIAPEFKTIFKGLADMMSILSLAQQNLIAVIRHNACAHEAPTVQPNKQPRMDGPSFSGLFNPTVNKGPFVPAGQHTSATNSTQQNVGVPIITIDGAGGNARQKTLSSQQQQQPPRTEEQIKKAAFRKAVEEAERSTLVLNLNLGRARIVNPDTISTNVTKALIAMAAAVEKEESGVPSAEAVESIDDVISVAKKMHLVGKFTKSVRNTKDKSLNGSYCTIPVKYEFPDRSTKFFADEVLRKTCGAQLAVPYPMILREAIRQIVEEKKKDYPDHLIKVNIDTRRLEFRVSRRLTKDSELIKFPGSIPIPPECLDITSRQIPDGFEVKIPGNSRMSRKDSADKEGDKSPPKNKSPQKNKKKANGASRDSDSDSDESERMEEDDNPEGAQAP